MKRAAIIMAVMAVSALGFGQNKPASGQTAAPAAAAAAPQGKRPPQAKTQPEFEAYKAAVALTDAAAKEKAADDFAAKFPDSELRAVLYTAAMGAYQQANNADKMLEMARKVLTYDPDEPEALVGLAQVLTDRTRDTDLDKDQRLAEAKKSADRALETVETDVPSAGQPADKVEAYKGFIRSTAYEVLGNLAFNAKTWPDAEANLRKSIDAFPQSPDPIAVYRLAVALDMQNKLDEAMKYCDQAIQLSPEGTAVGTAARSEKDRLTKLKSGSAPGAAPK